MVFKNNLKLNVNAYQNNVTIQSSTLKLLEIAKIVQNGIILMEMDEAVFKIL